MKKIVTTLLAAIAVSALGAQEPHVPFRFEKEQMPENALTNAKRLTYDIKDHELIVLTFHGGMCRIPGGPNGWYGFLDAQGNLALPFEYSNPNILRYMEFSDGAFAGWKLDPQNPRAKGTLSYFDKQGKPLFSLAPFRANDYEVVGMLDYSQGVAVIIVGGGLKKPLGKFIDKKGVVVPGSITVEYINSLFDWEGFHDGLAPMKANDQYNAKLGYVNTKGQWAIKPAYEKAHHFSDGMAAVMDPVSKKWGFIDTKGTMIVPFRFSNEPHDFHNGVCVVTNAEGFDCVIDKKGELLYTGTNYLGQLRDFGPEQIALVGPQYLNNYRGLIDAHGKLLAYDRNYIFLNVDTETGDFYDSESYFRYDKATGSCIQSPKELRLGRYSEGLAPAIYTKDGKAIKGFVNRKYEFIVIFEANQW